jgi:putative RNA 2'-phosphotransferase
VKAISKYLSLVLRHRPEAAGLVLDRQGWAAVEDVLAAVPW